MDSSLLLTTIARQRLLQALALGLPPQALSESLAPMLAVSPFLSLAAPAVVAPPAAVADLESANSSADWTPKEDELLKSLIAEHGTSKWSRVAAKMGTKSNRQCRRRWQALANCAGNKGSWTAEEDAKLMEGHRRYGNRWTDIARMVPGRTDNAVKNRFAALVAKGEGARSPKIQRWSDVCVVPKLADASPEKSEDGSSVFSSSPKRKVPFSPASSCEQEPAGAGKRLKSWVSLDLNEAPEATGWLVEADDDATSGCSQSRASSHSTGFFDLNSPAFA